MERKTQHNLGMAWLLLACSLLPMGLRGQQTDLYDLGLEELMALEVVSASMLAEPLEEVPVPVTVITSDMIRSSGARSLRDLLAICVPGMTVVQDHNEFNLAMRGVYASSQQKILVLLNGHRLNSRSYSSANPDFGLSLAKIKQVEVLRGPASSLYGNVALTAVVNIITQTGADMEGGQATLGLGNHGQRQASFNLGYQLGEADFFFWASYYSALGERLDIAQADDYSASPQAGQAIIDGNFDPPSYDLGFTFRHRGLSLQGKTRQSKYTSPFSDGGPTGQVYDYERFRTFLGLGPGLSTPGTNLGATYQKQWGKSGMSLNGYFDQNDILGELVLAAAPANYGVIGWKEYSFGSIAQFNHQHDWLGGGNLIVGAQAERMEVYDSFFLLGSGGELTSMADSSGAMLLARGTEATISGFVQAKQWLTSKLLLNVGGRFDQKIRRDGQTLSDFSPRLALVFLPGSRFDLKLSLANSFVDAPYWYRYNSLASYKGSSGLRPEHLRSAQLTPSFHFMGGRLSYSFNLFLNDLHDVIYRDPKATGEEPRYRNAGQLLSAGFENELAFLSDWLKLRVNLTYQRALEAENIGITEDRIHNIPGLAANALLDVSPFGTKAARPGFSLALRYIGAQAAPILATHQGGLPLVGGQDNRLDPVLLVNAGAHIGQLAGFGFRLNVTNLFDTRWEQGGSVSFPYPQAGRWQDFSVSYRF